MAGRQVGRSKLTRGRKVSSTGSKSSEPSETWSIGVELWEARERLGWGLADCAGALRIRRDYLAGLEEGQFDALPGRAYAAGFLRSYGKALGLDADELYAGTRQRPRGAAPKRPWLSRFRRPSAACRPARWC
jgi:cytoskeleton protein RodZ